MGPLIWKELREHIKWALLLMVGMGLAMAFVLSQGESRWYRYEGITICSDTFLVVTTVGCALAGILLGLLQVVLETRRDQWAFLVHRPTSRTTIWLGKVIAGMLLYLCATGIPLLLASWWAAAPGHVSAPFDWRMTLPGLADFLGGIVFYFAGMLTGLRAARWYGSRALGLAAAILCAWGVVQVPEFWAALIIITLFAAALALAAWGSFLTSGSFDFQPRLAKAGLGLSLLLGGYTTATLAAFLLVAIATPKARHSWTRYYITGEGAVLRVTGDFMTVEDIRDVDGNVIDKYSAAEYRDFDSLRPELLSLETIRGPRRREPSYRESTRFFAWVSRTGDLLWYYAHANGLLLAYSDSRRELVGSLGPEGFRPPSARRTDRVSGKWVGRWYANTIYPPFSDAVYKIDLNARTMTQHIAAGPGEEVYGAVTERGFEQKGGAPLLLAVCLGNRLVVLSENGDQLFTTDLAYNYQQYPTVLIVLLPKQERLFVWHELPWWLPREQLKQSSEHIVEYDFAGTELARHDLPAIVPEQTSSWYERTPALFMPLGAFAVLFGGQAMLGQAQSATGAPLILPLDDLTVFVVPALIAAVICVLATLLIGRRYAFSTRRLNCWAAIVLLLGPVALLLMWALCDWPARERCHACGRQRVVTREQCPHCAADFAPPALDCTEILEA